MTSITFETAAIADAIKKAGLVAPTRGEAFDKANGIVMDIFPDSDVQCVVRATNLAVYTAEGVNAIQASGNEVRWRLAANILKGVMESLPIGAGKNVTFAQEGSEVKMQSGRMKASMRLIDPSMYPNWDTFDPEGMSSIAGLGGKIALVEWACLESPQPPLCGVYLDGEWAIATDKFKMARVPCKVELKHPVTIPSGILSSVLRPLTDVSLAVRDTTLEILVAELHQVQTIVFGVEYPAAQIMKVMELEYPVEVEVAKQDLLSLINLALSMAGHERNPTVKMIFGRGEIAAMLRNAEVGFLGDVLEVPGQIGHNRVTLNFTPKILTDAISKAPSARVTLAYNPDRLKMPFRVSDGSGYMAWIQPKNDLAGAES